MMGLSFRYGKRGVSSPAKESFDWTEPAVKVVDNDQWVEDNFSTCELGDARRTKRLVKIAGNMLGAPEITSTAKRRVAGC